MPNMHDDPFDAANFLGGTKFSTSNSSNVSNTVYDYGRETLNIGYGDDWYGYKRTTPLEAASFALAQSKGKWVWDNLRQRGSATGHQKPYFATTEPFNLTTQPEQSPKQGTSSLQQQADSMQQGRHFARGGRVGHYADGTESLSNGLPDMPLNSASYAEWVRYVHVLNNAPTSLRGNPVDFANLFDAATAACDLVFERECREEDALIERTEPHTDSHTEKQKEYRTKYEAIQRHAESIFGERDEEALFGDAYNAPHGRSVVLQRVDDTVGIDFFQNDSLDSQNELQPGSKEFGDNLKTFVKKIKEEGLGVYAAGISDDKAAEKGGRAAQLGSRRQALYEKMLKRAGFVQSKDNPKAFYQRGGRVGHYADGIPKLTGGRYFGQPQWMDDEDEIDLDTSDWDKYDSSLGIGDLAAADARYLENEAMSWRKEQAEYQQGIGTNKVALPDYIAEDARQSKIDTMAVGGQVTRSNDRVSDAHIARMQAAHDALPAAVRRMMHSSIDLRADLDNERGAAGSYNPPGRKLTVYQYGNSPSDIPHVFRHETGHALDALIGWSEGREEWSANSKDYADALESDVSRMSEEAMQDHAYYLGLTDKKRGDDHALVETFAQNSAHLLGGTKFDRKEYEELYPDTLGVTWQKLVDEGLLDPSKPGGHFADGGTVPHAMTYVDATEGVNESVRSRVQQEYESLPAKLRELFDDQGGGIEVVPNLKSTLYPKSNADGRYNRPSKKITLSAAARTTKEALGHESGHFLDAVFGGISSTPEYGDALAKDVARMSDEQKKKYAYFLGEEEKTKARLSSDEKRRQEFIQRETFAQNFAFMLHGNKGVRGGDHGEAFESSLDVARMMLADRDVIDENFPVYADGGEVDIKKPDNSWLDEAIKYGQYAATAGSAAAFGAMGAVGAGEIGQDPMMGGLLASWMGGAMGLGASYFSGKAAKGLTEQLLDNEETHQFNAKRIKQQDNFSGFADGGTLDALKEKLKDQFPKVDAEGNAYVQHQLTPDVPSPILTWEQTQESIDRAAMGGAPITGDFEAGDVLARNKENYKQYEARNRGGYSKPDDYYLTDKTPIDLGTGSLDDLRELANKTFRIAYPHEFGEMGGTANAPHNIKKWKGGAKGLPRGSLSRGPFDIIKDRESGEFSLTSHIPTHHGVGSGSSLDDMKLLAQQLHDARHPAIPGEMGPVQKLTDKELGLFLDFPEMERSGEYNVKSARYSQLETELSAARNKDIFDTGSGVDVSGMIEPEHMIEEREAERAKQLGLDADKAGDEAYAAYRASLGKKRHAMGGFVDSFAAGGEVQLKRGSGGDDEPTIASEGDRVIPVAPSRAYKDELRNMLGGSMPPSDDGVAQKFGADPKIRIDTTPEEMILPKDIAEQNKPFLDAIAPDPKQMAAGGSIPHAAKGMNVGGNQAQAMGLGKSEAEIYQDALDAKVAEENAARTRQAYQDMFGGVDAQTKQGIGLLGQAAGGGAKGDLIKHGAMAAMTGNPMEIAQTVMAAVEVLKEYSKELDTANKQIKEFTSEFAQAIGVPKSIADLGAAVMNLFSPLKMLGDMFGVLITGIGAPIEFFKRGFKSIGDVTMSLAKVFLDLRDPAAMVQQVIAPFVNQVGKLNPGLVERFNVALDNLSAAMGFIFTPIIEEATILVNYFNGLATVVGPQFRQALESFTPIIREIVVVMGESLLGVLSELMPVIIRFTAELRAGGPYIRVIIEAVATVVTVLIQVADSVIFAFGEIRRATLVAVAAVMTFGQVLMEVTRAIPTAIQNLISRPGPAIQQVGAGLLNQPFNLLAGAFNWGRDQLPGSVAMRIPPIAQNPIPAPAGNQNPLGLPQINPQEMFNRILGQIGGGGGPAPLSNRPITIAAQQARQVGIEEIGLQARASAFGTGMRPEERAADALDAILNLLQNGLPGNPMPVLMQQLLRRLGAL